VVDCCFLVDEDDDVDVVDAVAGVDADDEVAVVFAVPRSGLASIAL